MRIRTDDEVYRVDAVWLGPQNATFPWRALYVAWLIGIPTFFVVLGIERWAGWSFGFFSTAWAFVATIVITRLLTAKISHERPSIGLKWTILRCIPASICCFRVHCATLTAYTRLRKH